MRMSELAERTGLPIPTLKYYLREGLLPAGEAQGATRAAYDESHVHRARLVRTLIEVGGLSLERVRTVVRALDQPPTSRHELLSTAHVVLRPEPADDDKVLAARLVELLGWPVRPDSAAALQLATAVGRARAGGWTCPEEMIREWGALAHAIATRDVADELAAMAPADALQHAILGTILTDPILVALRRVAQEAVSAERLST